MDWGIIADISAFAALLISIIIFALRLWGRRRKIVIHFEITYLRAVSGSEEYTINEDDEDPRVLLLRITNLGARPIVINKDRFMVTCNNKEISRYDLDWIGLEKIPHPLNPRSSCEVSIFQDSFEEMAGVKELSKYFNMNEYHKTNLPLHAELKDIEGRKYQSGKQYYYFFYVSEVEFAKERSFRAVRTPFLTANVLTPCCHSQLDREFLRIRRTRTMASLWIPAFAGMTGLPPAQKNRLIVASGLRT